MLYDHPISMSTNSRIPQTHRIILVRHAQSAVDAQRNPREWALSDSGRKAAQRLSALGMFDRVQAFYAGDEPKMVETVQPLAAAHGQEVQVEADLSETHAGGWIDGAGAFEATVRRFLAEPDQPVAPGWETYRAAQERFGRAIAQLCEKHDPVVYPGHTLPGTFVICSGGRAITAYVADLLGWTAEQAFDSWRSLRMPDLSVIDLSPTGEAKSVIPFGTLVV
jgi:broad specificity phosphatase PhoE